MPSAGSSVSRGRAGLIFTLVIAALNLPAAMMPPAQQNALVQKYCAVCHTDAAKNGGLSLQHYDAASPDPALAAMLLSKLQHGAMGAAGAGVPDQAAQDAWIEATTAQARTAKQWTVTRSEAPDSKTQILTASIVREVSARGKDNIPPVYRLAIACNTADRHGDLHLTWSPTPVTDKTFLVSADGKPGIQHRLEGREEKMGNGAALTAGLAAATLHAPLAEQTLTVTDLFPAETVQFPLGELDQPTRRQLAACFPSGN